MKSTICGGNSRRTHRRMGDQGAISYSLRREFSTCMNSNPHNTESRKPAIHVIYFSSLSCYLAAAKFSCRLWDAAKRSTGLFDLRHRVCTQQLDKPLLAPGQRIIPSMGTHIGSRFRHILVDLITDAGRVSLATLFSWLTWLIS